MLKFPEDIYNTITEGKSISSVSAIISGDDNKKCDFKRLLDEIISDKCNACNFIIIFEYDSHIYYDTNLPYKIRLQVFYMKRRNWLKYPRFFFTLPLRPN